MHPPMTPLTSRCGYLRSRKRINPHPISELRKRAKTEDPEDTKCLTEADTSKESELQTSANDSGIASSLEIGEGTSYLRAK
ncbi:uncharacterized protein LOC108046616 [Drosophila rhopaloa]|uniref:Uncharacterized protein n=1 Tax=Drosophila rhopaloa TaxID=1041015 RepID=A0ABM5HKZ5_DRORH|nr:uncharacterized protein LOC108046616 [Drosophila rhopaloa]